MSINISYIGRDRDCRCTYEPADTGDPSRVVRLCEACRCAWRDEAADDYPVDEEVEQEDAP